MHVLRSFQVWANLWMYLTLSRGTITSIPSRASFIRSRGFKLAITSEIIGKLGGGGVETIPVAISVSGQGTREIFRHIEATAEKPKLISVTGVGNYSVGISRRPVIEIGGTEWPTQDYSTPYSAVQVITEPSDIVFISQGSVDGTFTGTVYVAEM